MKINITTKLSPANTTTTNTDNKKKLRKYQRIITNYRFATKPAISGDVGITPVFTLYWHIYPTTVTDTFVGSTSVFTLYWHIYPTTVTGIFTLKEDDATTDPLSRKNSYKEAGHRPGASEFLGLIRRSLPFW